MDFFLSNMRIYYLNIQVLDNLKHTLVILCLYKPNKETFILFLLLFHQLFVSQSIDNFVINSILTPGNVMAPSQTRYLTFTQSIMNYKWLGSPDYKHNTQ